ncbi:MAG TPA: hypothetical protein VFJ13_07670 [Paracoccaceae bacterium]|nr:hypothetical protein [Paracoccaceae bacterium]
MRNPFEQEELKSWAEERDSIWRIAFGPLIWAVHFILTYGGTSVVCFKLFDQPWAMPFLRGSILAITVLALAGIGIVAWRSWQRWDYLDDYDYEHDRAVEEHRHEFLGHAAFLLAVLSGVGVIYVALPAAFMDSCA